MGQPSATKHLKTLEAATINASRAARRPPVTRRASVSATADRRRLTTLGKHRLVLIVEVELVGHISFEEVGIAGELNPDLAQHLHDGVPRRGIRIDDVEVAGAGVLPGHQRPGVTGGLLLWASEQITLNQVDAHLYQYRQFFRQFD